MHIWKNLAAIITGIAHMKELARAKIMLSGNNGPLGTLTSHGVLVSWCVFTFSSTLHGISDSWCVCTFRLPLHGVSVSWCVYTFSLRVSKPCPRYNSEFYRERGMLLR